jgi:arylsulfatase A-like enzyme
MRRGWHVGSTGLRSHRRALARTGRGILLAGMTAVGLPSCTSDPPRPNLLLITVDTLRADHLLPYGYDRATTPFLAEFAGRSVLFTDAIGQCGTTPQSLSSLMTGLFPYTDGILHRHGGFFYLKRQNTTLAGILSENGYRTHAITASLQSSIATGMELGFGSFDGVDVVRERKKIRRRKAGEMADLAIAWLQARGGADSPYFLWLHFLDPHHPYRAPPEYRDLFSELEPPTEGETRHYRFDAKRSRNYPLSDGELLRLIISYDRELRYLDDSLRRLFAEIGDGALDDTAVIFTADHGEGLGNHGIVGHNELYQTILRVPLMIRRPGETQPGRTVDLPVMLVDIVPTALDLLGIAVDLPLRGRSLKPWLDDGLPAKLENRFRLAEYEMQALYRGDFKLIVRESDREAYDVGRDPYEAEDLGSRMPGVQMELLARAAELKSAPLGPAGEAPPSGPDVTPAMLRELRALGYLDGGGHGEDVSFGDED